MGKMEMGEEGRMCLWKGVQINLDVLLYWNEHLCNTGLQIIFETFFP